MHFTWPYHLVGNPQEEKHRELWYRCVCLITTEGVYSGRELVRWNSLDPANDMNDLYSKQFPF